MDYLESDRHGVLRSIVFITVALGALVALAAAASASSHPTDCEVEGPDAFDYKCTLDVTYDFADTSGGEELSLGTFDRSEALEIPISFEWYDRDVDEVYVSSEGKVCFSLDDADCSDPPSQPVPDTETPNDLVACGWENLDPTRGTVRVANDTTVDDGDTAAFVVEYNGVPHWSQGETNTFQIQLLEDDSVRCMLDTVEDDDDGQDMTVGIENATGEEGVRYTSSEFAADKVAVAFGQGPPAPENLATERWFQQINLTWDPPTDEDGNEIDVDEYNVSIYDADGQLLGHETTTDTGFVDDGENQDVPGPGNDTTRSYEVAAVNEFGAGHQAGPVEDTTYGAPSEPLNVDAEPGNVTGTANLTWQTPEQPNRTDVHHTYYALQSDIGDPCPEEPGLTDDAWTAGPQENASTTETRLTDLEPAAMYCFTVTADNGAEDPGVGEGDPAISNASIAAGPPSAPQNVDAQPGSEQGDVDVAWDAPEHLNGTDVYHTYHALRSDLGDACPEDPDHTDSDNWTAGPDTTPPTTEATISDLDTGTVYCFTVTAEDEDASDAGEGAAAPPDASAPLGEPGPPENAAAEHDPGYSDADEEVGAINVTWDKPVSDGGEDIQEYQLYRAVDDGDFGFRGAVDGDTFRFEDTALDCRTTYTYRITAENSVGESDPTEVSETTSGICPDAPADLTADPVNKTDEGDVVQAVVLDWDEPEVTGTSSINAYVVERSGGGESVTVAEIPGRENKTSAEDPAENLDCGTGYTYNVTAINDAGESVPATVDYMHSAPCPSEPLDVTATAGDNAEETPDTNAVNVSWERPEDTGWAALSGFELYRCDADASACDEPGNENWTLVDGQLGADARFVEDTGRSAGEDLAYALVASNDFGDGPFSDVAQADVADAPDSPENVTAESGPTETAVNITWEPPTENGGAEVLKYHVYERLATDGEESWERIESVGADQRSIEHEVSSSGVWCYSVSADNTFEGDRATVNEPFDQEKCVVVVATDDAPPIPSPDVLSCDGLLGDLPVLCPSTPENPDASAKDRTITLTWNAPDDDVAPNGYEIHRTTDVRTEAGGTICEGLAPVAVTEETSFEDTELDPGTEYCYRVVAYRGLDLPVTDPVMITKSSPTENRTATTDSFPDPVAAEDLTVETGLGTASLTWTEPQDGGSAIQNYTVYEDRSCTDQVDATHKVDHDDAAADQTLELAALPAGTYCFEVTATNGVGESDRPDGSVEAEVTAEAPAPPSDVSATSPEDGSVTIEWSDPSDTGGPELFELTVERKSSGGDWTTAGTLEPGTEELTDDGLAQGIEFCYRVIATNEALDEDGEVTAGIESNPSMEDCETA